MALRSLHVVFALALTAGAAAACSDLHTYLLSGQLYDQAQGCLGEELVIDVIEGEATDGCKGVKCLRSTETGDLFVTTNCDVPELYEDLTTQDSGPCADALAAYELGDAGLCK